MNVEKKEGLKVKMETMIGEKWCKVEIYNEYLKKIASLLHQINTVEQMLQKAEIELQMFKDDADTISSKQYQERLHSTKTQCERRLSEMKEELCLIQALKEQLENELDFLHSKNR